MAWILLIAPFIIAGIVIYRIKSDGDKEPQGWEKAFVIGKEDLEKLEVERKSGRKFVLFFILPIAMLVVLLSVFDDLFLRYFL